MNNLNINFLSGDTLSAARQLLGVEIVTEINGELTSGFITEVEAYLGLNDRASHTFGGKITKKNAMMFEPYGHIYVYSMHGHNCMNFVTTTAQPEGVLIRGIEPHRGIDTMKKRRNKDEDLTAGPGKLTKALGINRTDHNGLKINSEYLHVHSGRVPSAIEETVRIGIDNKEEAADYLYRFVVKGNPHVSKFKGQAADNNGWQ